jgi:thiamine biosynthesis protein ThiC
MNDEIKQAMDKAFRLLMSAPTADDVARALALVEWSQQMRLALTAQSAEAVRQKRASKPPSKPKKLGRFD